MCVPLYLLMREASGIRVSVTAYVYFLRYYVWVGVCSMDLAEHGAGVGRDRFRWGVKTKTGEVSRWCLVNVTQSEYVFIC